MERSLILGEEGGYSCDLLQWLEVGEGWVGQMPARP
jgi:hypothetical protein